MTIPTSRFLQIAPHPNVNPYENVGPQQEVLDHFAYLYRWSDDSKIMFTEFVRKYKDDLDLISLLAYGFDGIEPSLLALASKYQDAISQAGICKPTSYTAEYPQGLIQVYRIKQKLSRNNIVSDDQETYLDHLKNYKYPNRGLKFSSRRLARDYMKRKRVNVTFIGLADPTGFGMVDYVRIESLADTRLQKSKQEKKRRRRLPWYITLKKQRQEKWKSKWQKS